MFALGTAESIYWPGTLLSFFILHFLVFPSSNGYNSYHDKDTSSIGMLKNPPPVSSKLFYATLFMDFLAIGLGLWISIWFSLLVFLFILVSRAYSYRPIRLKRYPIISFLLVALFQGAAVYLSSLMAIRNIPDLLFFNYETATCMAISSLFIGSIYPLTQIYQHQSDKADGVTTISYKLGYTGTFLFSALLFISATFLVYKYFSLQNQVKYFQLFVIITLPIIIWFLVWFYKVFKNTSQANYSNTMYMNLITSICMNVFFLFLTLNRYGNWY